MKGSNNMLQLIKILIKLIESKLIKSGIEQTILKNQNYFIEAKKIWNMVDENFRISKTVEEKLESKVEQFDKYLLDKFPELTQSDIDSIRQSIAGEINQGKEEVVSSSTLLQQLQSTNVELTNTNSQLQSNLKDITDENTQLKNKIIELTNKWSAMQNAFVTTDNIITAQPLDNSNAIVQQPTDNQIVAQ
jgi:uncharacterized protein YdiU (UPF0061 family)